jgi:putative transposase
MAGPKPPEVPLSEQERAELTRLSRRHKTSQQIALRARIVLSLNAGLNTEQVARQLATTPTTVRLWRRHWFERASAEVVARLQDDERSGAPPTFTSQQWCQIIALACEDPQASGRPITHWTPRELAEEAVAREIVTSISTRHVGRFLKSGGVEAASQRLLAQQRPGPTSRTENR